MTRVIDRLRRMIEDDRDRLAGSALAAADATAEAALASAIVDLARRIDDLEAALHYTDVARLEAEARASAQPPSPLEERERSTP